MICLAIDNIWFCHNYSQLKALWREVKTEQRRTSSVYIIRWICELITQRINRLGKCCTHNDRHNHVALRTENIVPYSFVRIDFTTRCPLRSKWNPRSHSCRCRWGRYDSPRRIPASVSTDWPWTGGGPSWNWTELRGFAGVNLPSAVQ